MWNLSETWGCRLFYQVVDLRIGFSVQTVVLRYGVHGRSPWQKSGKGGLSKSPVYLCLNWIPQNQERNTLSSSLHLGNLGNLHRCLDLCTKNHFVAIRSAWLVCDLWSESLCMFKISPDRSRSLWIAATDEVFSAPRLEIHRNSSSSMLISAWMGLKNACYVDKSLSPIADSGIPCTYRWMHIWFLFFASA